jgi:hypothetical protein
MDSIKIASDMYHPRTVAGSLDQIHSAIPPPQHLGYIYICRSKLEKLSLAKNDGIKLM